MVAIMSSCCAAEEVVAAVYCCCLNKLPRQEYPHCEDVCAQNGRWQYDRERVGHDVLYRVRILRGERHRRRELVVNFVNAAVEIRDVEKTMQIVEEDLSADGTEQKVHGEGLNCRERGSDLEGGRSALGHGGHSQANLDGSDEYLIPKRYRNGLPDIGSRRLLRGWLDLVLGGKRRGDVI